MTDNYVRKRTKMKAVAPKVTDRQGNPRPWLANVEQKQLLSRYPIFFRAVDHPEAYPSNIAHFGIQCGFGWYGIIEEMAREVESELRTMWEELIEFPLSLSLMDGLLLQGLCEYPVVPVCTDISQFAGEMIVDVMDGQVCGLANKERIQETIEKAKSKSRVTCESCGKPGKYRKVYFRHVLCDECMAPSRDEESQDDLSVCVDERNDGNGSGRPRSVLEGLAHAQIQ
ncbi:hypothetical protein FVF58_10445 [Paraburkholderia panacisoli]|uniref:Uncharacterized protein n=1 Tax=Paraburkholderia panacisoli TaxID=2603818 RepID=A0A5B0HCY2_9BURK|nr:hypothetical protein [Paraburkholderia panacisoli]KAA1013176.1 hypothetical protein FVF58_10445 [Paraburkholderia panacisoli]